jgi:hypothetical protein
LQLACDFIDNFARSIPSNHVAAVGSLVDSDIFAQAVKARDKHAVSILPDFKTQVRQFLQYEQGKHRVPSRLRKVDEWTIFTVSFGLWDLFEYSALEQPAAIKAVDSSIETLFEGLDLLAQHAAAPIKVVVPSLVDVTFLPRFQARRKDIAHEQSFAEEQHKLVFLSTYWNTALSRTALQWKNGDLFMPDPNTIIVDQARAKQLHSQHESDASGAGSQQPLFEHIQRPCLTLGPGRSAADLNAATMQKCADADRHLFWYPRLPAQTHCLRLTVLQGRLAPQRASPRANRQGCRQPAARQLHRRPPARSSCFVRRKERQDEAGGPFRSEDPPWLLTGCSERAFGQSRVSTSCLVGWTSEGPNWGARGGSMASRSETTRSAVDSGSAVQRL